MASAMSGPAGPVARSRIPELGAGLGLGLPPAGAGPVPPAAVAPKGMPSTPSAVAAPVPAVFPAAATVSGPVPPPPTLQPRAKIAAADTVISSSAVSASIVLTEPVVFVYGFSKSEQVERAPAMLRGSLVLRVFKPTKIRTISLEFKGTCRTEWPEGIPPKKVETHESTDLHKHGWMFFSASLPGADTSSGAHFVHPLDSGTSLPMLAAAFAAEGAAHEPLVANTTGGSLASAATPPAAGGAASSLGVPVTGSGGGPTPLRGRSRANTLENVQDILNSVKAVGKQRQASPSPAVVAQQQDTQARGYRTFQPAEYVYNFELAIPQIIAETLRANFGSVRYQLEAHIDRAGTFKTNLVGHKDVTILRSLAMSNLNSSEPIVISRDWESLLHYEVVIAGKAFPIGGHIPIAFSLVPLDKLQCHRIRVYLTEHTEYYAHHRKVHRVEPSHKFMILEKLPPGGVKGNLLASSGPGELSAKTEFEFNVKIPTKFRDQHDQLHPNFSSTNIKVHHWIKIVMRLSRKHPRDPKRLKSYEVSIDSPITLVDMRTITASQLPVYDAGDSEAPIESYAFQAHQGFMEVAGAGTTAAILGSDMRPIHVLRRPSRAPPAFDADSPPPEAFPQPPGYDETQESLQSYRERLEEHERAERATALELSDNNSEETSASLTSATSATTVETGSASVDSPTSAPETGTLADSRATTETTLTPGPSVSLPNEASSHGTNERSRFTEIFWREDSEEEEDGVTPPLEVHAEEEPVAAGAPIEPHATVVATNLPVDSPVDASASLAPRERPVVPPPRAVRGAELNPALSAALDAVAHARLDSTRGSVPSPGTVPPPSLFPGNLNFHPSPDGLGANSSALMSEPVSPEAVRTPGSPGPLDFAPAPTDSTVLDRLPPPLLPDLPIAARTTSRGSVGRKGSANFGPPLRPSTSSASLARAPVGAVRRPSSAAASPGTFGGDSYFASPARRGRNGSQVSHGAQRQGSVSSARYYRQASVVSLDGPGAESSLDLRRWSSRVSVSEASEVPEWYAGHRSRRGSDASIAVSVSEYQGPDRRPLLPSSSDGSGAVYDDLDYDGSVAFPSDFAEDDVESLRGSVFSLRTPLAL